MSSRRPLELSVDESCRANCRTVVEMLSEEGPLVWIQGEENSIHHPNTHITRTMRCFICRWYKSLAPKTVWKCARCRMSLCHKDRNRNETCLREHQRLTDKYLNCRTINHRIYRVMPRHLKIFERLGAGAVGRMRRRRGKICGGVGMVCEQSLSISYVLATIRTFFN